MRATLLGAALWVATALPVTGPTSARELSGEAHTVSMPEHRAATDWLSQLSALSAHSAPLQQAAAPSSPSSSGTALVAGLMQKLSGSTASSGTARSAPSHAMTLSDLLGSGATAGAGKQTGEHAAPDPLVTALMAAAMSSPRGFQVLTNPGLLNDPAVRGPILWHVLSNRNVQRELLHKVDQYAETIVTVIGEPRGMNAEQKQSFVQATENAIRRSLEPEALNLLVNDHEYIR